VGRAGESPVELELIRGGGSFKLTVKPVKDLSAVNAAGWSAIARQTEPTRQLLLVHPNAAQVLIDQEIAEWTHQVAGTQPTTQPVAERLSQITGQLEQLRQAVDALRADLESQRGTGKAQGR
jgi:hypothetical protein